MKRGNTALKRGLGLASVFALAVAGAVVAAPAASAAVVGAADSVRAIPTADAAWMAADGTVLANKDLTGPDYGKNGGAAVTNATGLGANLTVGKNGQPVSGIQVKLPTTAAGAPQWAKGDTITVTLAGGGSLGAVPNVAFSGNATATLSAAPLSDPTDLDQVAGVANATNHQSAAALESGAGVAALANTSGVVKKVDAAPNQFTVALPDPTGAHGTAAVSAYLLTVTGITVNVAAANTGTQINTAVTAQVQVGATDAGTTTVGYINGLNIATNGSASATGVTVSLPPVVVSEAAAGLLNGAGTFAIQATGTPATGSALTVVDPTVAPKATFAGTNSVTGSVAGATDTFTVSYAAADVTKSEAVVISGLKVSNVKAGTDVDLTITAPTAAAADASAFSFVGKQLAGSSVTVSPATALPRIFGANRFDTAAKIADKLGATNAVILANGDNAKLGVDALSANFLAGAKNDAPVLLTSADSLPAETAAELTSLFENSTANITLYVMGKTDSVSQKVRDAAVAAIKAKAVNALATVTVVEVAGADRYATSAATVDKAGASNIESVNLGKGSRNTAFLASGQVNADALAASAVSAGLNIPVLLTTNGKILPDSVQKTITDDSITQVIILGSTDRVSTDVADALTKDGVNVVRLAGTDRYDTAQQIAALALKAQPNGLSNGTPAASTVYLANGDGGWADALAVGPLAGSQSASLVTVSSAASLPGSTAVFLAANKTAFTAVDGLGNTDRVSDSALKQALALLGLS